MTTKPTDIIKSVDRKKKKWLEEILGTREMILANLSLISQCPAQTFNESERSRLIVDRFGESGISEPTVDNLHNVIGKFHTENAKKNILVFTHMDNQFDLNIDQNISISENRVSGSGVADDNLALAVLMTMPDILSRLNLKLDSNIFFVATTRFHGRGDYGGIRNYIKNHGDNIDVAINLNGITLGAIDYFTLSRVRCDIRCDLDLDQDIAWMKSTNDSAIMILNDIINSLFSIPLPRRPKTVLNLGMLSGGERYSTVSREATASLEVLSEDDDIMDRIIDNIRDNCTDVAAKHGAQVTTDFFGRHKAAGLSSSHPLMKTAFSIIQNLGFKPTIKYSNSEIAAPLSHGIPSISVGLTTGRSGSTPKSYVDIEPISIGVLQLIDIIYAIDMEYDTNE